MNEDLGNLHNQLDDHNAKLQTQVDELGKKMTEDNAKLQKQMTDDSTKLQKQVDDYNAKLQAQIHDLRKKMTEDNTKLQGQVDDISNKISKMCEMQTEMMKGVSQIMAEVKQFKIMSQSQHLVGKNIIIAGGYNGNAHTNSVEIFLWSQKTWTLINPMSTYRTYASAVTYKGEIRISGGFDGKRCIDTIEINSFDQPVEWKISRIKLPEVCRSHATVMYKDSLILSGGCASAQYKSANKIHEISKVPPYSTEVLTTMPEPRCDHTMEVFEDKLFIFGGYHGNAHDTVMMYNLVTKEWKMMKPLSFPVDEMASVLWQNNVILLGGKHGTYNVADNVVMYNLTTGESKYLPSMKHKRCGCAAVVTGDVLVVMGGHDEVNYLKSVEAFHFQAQVWEELPDMNEARGYASAVVKPN